MKDKSYENNLEFETKLLDKGYKYIAGVDEVGRGCWAGPVVCAAVIMTHGVRIPYLTDSKAVPKSKHELLVEEIKKSALAYRIEMLGPEIIDSINIRNATLLGMKNAVEGLVVKADYCLVDGRDKIDVSTPQQSIIKGDYFSHTISAASLLAKWYRDNLMKKLDLEYDGKYEWSKNVGYPTAKHRELVEKYGVTKEHRLTWTFKDGKKYT